MKEEEKYKEAKKRVNEIKGFYSHFFSYIGVNIILLIINFTTSPSNLWFYFVTAFWGIGVFWHAMGVFVFEKFLDKNWEKRKIKELIKKYQETE